MMCKGKEKREIPDKFVLNFPLCGGRVRERLPLKPGGSGKLSGHPRSIRACRVYQLSPSLVVLFYLAAGGRKKMVNYFRVAISLLPHRPATFRNHAWFGVLVQAFPGNRAGCWS